MPNTPHFLADLPAHEIEGKKIFLRVDLNVPIKNGIIMDDFRIAKALPTIEYLHMHGAKLRIATHLGEDGSASIEPVRVYLSHHLGDDDLLLPNLRSDPREMVNDPQYARELAGDAELYINEAFSVSHREHASVVGIPKLIPGYGGFLFQKEIEQLSRVFAPVHPMVAVVGGAKFETKIPLLEKFLDLADTVFVSGALCNDFFSAMGYGVGDSLVASPELVKRFVGHPKIRLPIDIITQNRAVKKPNEIESDERILDVGPETLSQMGEAAMGASMIVWNGPLGKYEDGFSEATDAYAEMVAGSRAFSVLGGGDTLASIKKMNLLDRFGFVSTGGGAMLDFIAKGTLPGIEALKR